MAIDKDIKNKYDRANAAYNESNSIKNARNNLIAMAENVPNYQNSYANQLSNIYKQISNGNDFNYDSNNDVAFRRFAEEYNALSGLAIAGNQQQAQDLTGGYGSTYAPEVARQGLANLQFNANKAEPYFMEIAQEVYKQDNDRLNNAYWAGSNARNDELSEYERQIDAYNYRNEIAQQKYSDERDFEYAKYKNNRDYWAEQYNNDQQQSNFEKEYSQTETLNKRDYKLKSYDTYNKLAASKCAEYKDKKNNKGMKAYLDGLVSSAKITQYMADNLYKQYKYTAPARSGGGGGGTGYTGYGSDSGGTGGNGGVNTISTSDFIYQHGSIVNRRTRQLNGHESSLTAEAMTDKIRTMYSNGQLTADDAAYLLNYYGLDGSKTVKKKR